MKKTSPDAKKAGGKQSSKPIPKPKVRYPFPRATLEKALQIPSAP
jgi:hypothetical protein